MTLDNDQILDGSFVDLPDDVRANVARLFIANNADDLLAMVGLDGAA